MFLYCPVAHQRICHTQLLAHARQLLLLLNMLRTVCQVQNYAPYGDFECVYCGLYGANVTGYTLEGTNGWCKKRSTEKLISHSSEIVKEESACSLRPDWRRNKENAFPLTALEPGNSQLLQHLPRIPALYPARSFLLFKVVASVFAHKL